jgi:hypothetical protein
VRRIKGEGVKSRYVLQDLSHGRPADGGELFAATPSLLSVRTVLALSSRDMAAGKEQLLIFGDVTQAFPHAPLDRAVWTRLPSECEGMETVVDGETVALHGGDAVVVARALYGHRRSPKLWQAWFTKVVKGLKTVKFKQSSVDPTVFWNAGGVRLVVYVDDIILAGEPEETERVFVEICERMRMREVGRLGKDGDSGKFLGREIKRIDGGYAMRCSETLIDELIRRTGVQSGHAVATPVVKYSAKELANSMELEGAEATAYRGVAGLGIHLGHDRLDVQFAAKEAARSMSHPRQCDWWRVKRMSRYLHHHRSVWQNFVCTSGPV